MGLEGFEKFDASNKNAVISLAQRALAEHELSRAWLQRELVKHYDGKTVVISHHGPHPLSVHPRYIGEALNAAFVSNLSELLPKADLWIHGHVHDSFDYRVHGCRVIANPAGYTLNRNSVGSAKELVFENKAFQWARVAPMATSNSPTCGQSNSPRQDGWIMG